MKCIFFNLKAAKPNNAYYLADDVSRGGSKCSGKQVLEYKLCSFNLTFYEIIYAKKLLK
jgi:hypothetical protein